MTNPINISANLKKLKEIADWFDQQEDVDIEEGLQKVKDSVALIKECRSRLADIQNEFNEVKREIESTDSIAQATKEEQVQEEKDDVDKIPF